MIKMTNTLAACLLLAALTHHAAAQTAAKSDEYKDFNPGRSTVGSEWTQSIVIKAPELRSEVKGDVKVEFQAPGMTVARALCWQQPTKEKPDPFGHDTLIGSEIPLDAQGNGSFVFPADQFPNGPVTVRILANNADSSLKDSRELQLFNKGGVVWNQGIPKTDPPAAQGMKLVFADDFDGPLSISKDGQGAKYCSHKPGGGDFSGWPFSNFEGPLNPFSQVGTWLRIHASKNPDGKSSSGLIAPVKLDCTGFYATAPFYMECRFTAQSAPGTWPAFWSLTKNGTVAGVNSKVPGDELDIVEAYGGVGKGNPNSPGYSVTSHFWNQTGPDGKPLPVVDKRIEIKKLGGKSYWSTTFHTYAVKVTETDTIYYFDDIEVLRHPSGAISKSEPAYFLINYAIGGISGWKIDLEREGNATDMWVDYVRVYEGGK
ncbi:MAG: family 16 glycosylhydrolase [Terrimicrobiaceae bacterium]